MDPQSEKTPGLHLPQPSVSEGVSFDGQYEEMPQKPEFAVASPEVKRDVPQFAPPSPVPLTPTDDSSDASGQSQQAASQMDDDDADDLDKEWISKAKLIVEQTKADPFVQSKELSKVKADYLRIRYNKHIKVSQDQSL